MATFDERAAASRRLEGAPAPSMAGLRRQRPDPLRERLVGRAPRAVVNCSTGRVGIWHAPLRTPRPPSLTRRLVPDLAGANVRIGDASNRLLTMPDLRTIAGKRHLASLAANVAVRVLRGCERRHDGLQHYESGALAIHVPSRSGQPSHCSTWWRS
jgi:hypothetical protein